jgi:tetratricopeptide (TPR) repeat protein
MKSKIHENQNLKMKTMSTKLITALALFVCSLLTAQGQFEQGMGKAFTLWGEGKNTEASDLFERIAAAEKDNWLPNYYVTLVNTTAAFGAKDKDKMNLLLSKAQNALDIEMAKNQNNAELYVMQAMINTAWIVFDPMTNGQKLSAPTIELYNKALAIAPNNPRVVFGKAEFEIGGAKFWGTDTKPMCAQIEKAIGLFATFKPETPFSPKWGLDRALEAQKNCK